MTWFSKGALLGALALASIAIVAGPAAAMPADPTLGVVAEAHAMDLRPDAAYWRPYGWRRPYWGWRRPYWGWRYYGLRRPYGWRPFIVRPYGWRRPLYRW